MTAERPAALQAEYDRMHSYYVTQGERYSFAELWPRASKARLQLLDSLEGLSDAQGAFDPGGGDWSIKEVAHHILNSSRNVRRTVAALAAGMAPGASDVEPPREATDAPMDELREGLRDDGIAWTVMIAGLEPRPPGEPTSPHPMFGELGARAWYLFQRTHDLDHMNQIEAVKQAEGYPAAE